MLTPSFALWLFVLAGGVAIVGQLLVLRDAMAGRTPAASATVGGRAREVLWIAIPAVALALVVLATWRALPRRDVLPIHHEQVPAIRTGALSPAAD